MTRFAQMTMTAAFLAVLAVPVYAGEVAVPTPAAPSVPAVGYPIMKDIVVETTTGAVTETLVPTTEVKPSPDTLMKSKDEEKVETVKKIETLKKPEIKTDLKHHDTVKKDDKKIEQIVPEVGKH